MGGPCSAGSAGGAPETAEPGIGVAAATSTSPVVTIPGLSHPDTAQSEHRVAAKQPA